MYKIKLELSREKKKRNNNKTEEICYCVPQTIFFFLTFEQKHNFFSMMGIQYI